MCQEDICRLKMSIGYKTLNSPIYIPVLIIPNYDVSILPRVMMIPIASGQIGCVER
jgi:hypothetical protein